MQSPLTGSPSPATGPRSQHFKIIQFGWTPRRADSSSAASSLVPTGCPFTGCPPEARELSDSDALTLRQMGHAWVRAPHGQVLKPLAGRAAHANSTSVANREVTSVCSRTASLGGVGTDWARCAPVRISMVRDCTGGFGQREGLGPDGRDHRPLGPSRRRRRARGAVLRQCLADHPGEPMRRRPVVELAQEVGDRCRLDCRRPPSLQIHHRRQALGVHGLVEAVV